MANKLKEMRYKRMLSMSELSRRSGVSRPTIWALETQPDKVVTSKTMAALARALEMPEKDIFFTDSV